MPDFLQSAFGNSVNLIIATHSNDDNKHAIFGFHISIYNTNSGLAEFYLTKAF